MTVNRMYKDRLFKKLFGSEEYKENTLSLYNAINGTSYTNPDDLEFATIDDFIFMSMKNDVSFMVDMTISLYEQQSSYNPNMPLRGLLYFGRQYEKYVAKYHNNRQYSSKLIQLPTPKFVVLYNGKPDDEDKELRFTDAVTKPKESDIEVIAHMINISSESGSKILERCKILKEYSILIEFVKDNILNGDEIETAVLNAVNNCIDKNILASYLIKHKSEVIGMIYTEYNEEEVKKALQEEAREEGREEGREEERLDAISKMLTLLTMEQILSLGYSKEEINQAMAAN